MSYLPLIFTHNIEFLTSRELALSITKKHHQIGSLTTISKLLPPLTTKAYGYLLPMYGYITLLYYITNNTYGPT